ncbi:MAG: DUF4190 domain-containing protein [Phycisphaerales bacterium]|nr:DUF4190 domain-containing protein [Phycisphaerales bacterium]
MTNSQDEHGGPNPPPAPQGRPVAPRLSALAVVAVVVACLPCPPMSLVGAVLGLMALSRIRHSGGTLTGVNVARVAIILSLVVTLAGVLVLRSLEGYLQRTTNEAITTTVYDFIVQSSNGNTTGALAQWDLRSTPVDIEAVGAFGETVTEQLGPLKSLRVGKVSQAANAAFLEQAVDVWLIYEFEAGSRNGAGALVLEMDMQTFQWKARLRQLRIEDPDGQLSMPPVAEDAPPLDPPPGDPTST